MLFPVGNGSLNLNVNGTYNPSGQLLYLNADNGYDSDAGTWTNLVGSAEIYNAHNSPVYIPGYIGDHGVIDLSNGYFRNDSFNIIANPGDPFTVLYVAEGGNSGQILCIRRTVRYTGPIILSIGGTSYLFSDGQVQLISANTSDIAPIIISPYDGVFSFGGLGENLIVTLNGTNIPLVGNPLNPAGVASGTNGSIIGNNSQPQLWGGKLAEIRVLDHAITEDELTAWRAYVQHEYNTLNNGKLLFHGHWNNRLGRAFTNNTGNYIKAKFSGTGISAKFNTQNNVSPIPTFAWQIDGGSWEEAEIASTVQLANSLAIGNHTLTLMTRGFEQFQERWTPPIVALINFTGFSIENGNLLQAVETVKPHLLFIGDSITEGIRIWYPDGVGPGKDSTAWQDDGRTAWPCQTSQGLNADWEQVGFGGAGVLSDGSGGVPKTQLSFPYNYANQVTSNWVADIIINNIGQNDGVNPSAFQNNYTTLLNEELAKHPNAYIICMRPFSGAHAADILSVVTLLANPKILYLDTSGWIDPTTDTSDGVHPNALGSGIIAGLMISYLQTIPPFGP